MYVLRACGLLCIFNISQEEKDEVTATMTKNNPNATAHQDTLERYHVFFQMCTYICTGSCAQVSTVLCVFTISDADLPIIPSHKKGMYHYNILYETLYCYSISTSSEGYI